MNKKINEKLFEGAGPGVHDIVLALLVNEPRGKVLDAPAGSGAMSRRLKNIGFNVLAIDINPDTFKASEVDFMKVDLNKDLPFPDNFFDYIVCIEGIEHLENHFHLLREFKRILKKNGKLVLTTPNILNIHYRLRYLFLGYADWLYGRILKKIPSDIFQFLNQHINPVDFIKLKYICEKENFVIEKICVNRSMLLYPDGRLFLKPVIIPILFISAIFVRLIAKLLKPRDPILKTLLSNEILFGETLILKMKKT